MFSGTKLPLILLFSFIGSLFAQDTLILCRKSDAKKEFRIPFASFNVKVKTRSQGKLNAMIMRRSDSSLHLRIRRTNRKIKEELSKHYAQADTTRYPASFNNAQFDSVLKAVKWKAVLIEYPDTSVIAISKVKKFVVANRHRPEKKKLIKRMNLAGFLVIPPVFFIAATEEPVIMAVVYGLAGAWAITAVSIQSKRLSMKKWKVVR